MNYEAQVGLVVLSTLAFCGIGGVVAAVIAYVLDRREVA